MQPESLPKQPHFLKVQVKKIKKTIKKFVLQKILKDKSGDPLFLSLKINNTCKPVSPIDGQPAERLLFTSMDTRFGGTELNDIYLDTRNEIAVTYPPISSAQLDALYREHYSKQSTEIKYPVTLNSPYSGYFGGKKWERLFFILPIEIMNKLLRIYNWEDATVKEIKKMIRSSGVSIDKKLRFLDVGCFEGLLLDQLSQQTSWELFGLEPNEQAVKIAREKGHNIWQCHAEEITEKINEGIRFDVIYLGQCIEHLDNPVFVLRRLRMLLAPGGVLVASTPNLLSKQVEWFGPTWSHWHPPYHRYIFSKKGLLALSAQVGLSVVKFRTFSHSYWTAMSMMQNQIGLGGSVSHNTVFNRQQCRRAQRLTTWLRLLWDWRGQGDYCYVVMNEGSK